MSLHAQTPPSASVTVPTFEHALFLVSNCLAEARCCEERGATRRAQILYTLAERYAVRTGFTELIRLVWLYQEPPAVASDPAPAH
jgi:hypothetical protein